MADRKKIQTLKAGKNRVDQESLPDRYARWGNDQIEFVEPGRLRWYFSGAVGSGKSSFAMSLPNTVVLDFENKDGGLPRHPTTMRSSLSNASAYYELLNTLLQDGAGHPFQTIVFDPIEHFVDLVRWKLSEENSCDDITQTGREGSGWNKVNVEVNKVLAQLYGAGFGLGWLSHINERIVSDNQGNQRPHYETKLNPGVRSYVYQQAEFTGVIECEKQRIRDEKGKPTGDANVIYVLNLDRTHDRLPTRQHVPMGDEPIILPDRTGGEVFFQAYREAVERRKAELKE